MEKKLVEYYEEELDYVRRLGALFGQDHPRVAGNLRLLPDICNDPHVERLIEAFSFLTARVRKKLDDELPEVSESLLHVVYPHFLRPVPSFTIVQFELDPEQPNLEQGVRIDRETELESKTLPSRRQGTDPQTCKYRTVYPVTLWPIRVAEAKWTSPDLIGLNSVDAAAAIRLELSCLGTLKFSQLSEGGIASRGLDSLQFHIHGNWRLVNKLYELLCSRLKGILVRNPASRTSRPVPLPKAAFRPMGFDDDEGALPYPGRSFTGYRLLQEYFAFPQKFLFFEISGLGDILNGDQDGDEFGSSMELIFLFSDSAIADRQALGRVDRETFRLGCTPAVNLFNLLADPIPIDQTRSEYPVIPDKWRPRAYEVFSVDTVHKVTPSEAAVAYPPFFGFRHIESQLRQGTYWIESRRPSPLEHDDGNDTVISLVNLTENPARAESESLQVRTTCTNRDLPRDLEFRVGTEQLNLEDHSDRGDLLLNKAVVRRTVILREPTRTRRFNRGEDTRWRLISQLSLNYISLLEENGAALRQMLSLYDFEQSEVTQGPIAGIVGLKHSPEFAPVSTDENTSFVRGTRVVLELDANKFDGGLYLFASVIEHFLGLYASMNSFVRLCVKTRQHGDQELFRWAPRAGRRILM